MGTGFGGFVDGIVLHQILQWHNMLSARIPLDSMGAMRVNMSADGWFHAAVWLLSVVGVVRFHAGAFAGDVIPGRREFGGLMLFGWGMFNLIEGVLDHHVLELHHVRDVPFHQPEWDWLFLLIGGVGFVVTGWLLTRAPSVRPGERA